MWQEVTVDFKLLNCLQAFCLFPGSLVGLNSWLSGVIIDFVKDWFGFATFPTELGYSYATCAPFKSCVMSIEIEKRQI